VPLSSRQFMTTGRLDTNKQHRTAPLASSSSSGGVSKRRGAQSPGNKPLQDRLGPKPHITRLGPPVSSCQTEASVLLKPSLPPKPLTPAQKLAKRLGPSPASTETLLKKTRQATANGAAKKATGDLRQRIGIARSNQGSKSGAGQNRRHRQSK
jgi:hypothetical protein